ncbi:MAG: diaminopimelate decarboxylase [Acidimicrobiales bacterium]|nr:diaminopimelate decarboxylase [Acidimicrobiales bacterium]
MLPDPDPEPPHPPGHGPLPLSLLPDHAGVDQDGRLSIAGVDVLDLVQEVGTPVFIYDEEHMRRRCAQAVDAWGTGVAYASKAFLCRAMAQLAYEEGMFIDVSTAGEMHVALRAGVPADRLVLHGNNKSDSELRTALEVGVGRIVIDSFDEIDRLDRLVPTVAAGRRPRALLRVTPGIEAHTHEYVMTGQDDSKFGFGLASGAAAEGVARLSRPGSPVDLVGLHAHIGSQIFALESFERAIAMMADFFLPLGLRELCVGGGLGVAYIEGEESLPIVQWAERVRAAAKVAGLGDDVRLTAEPGRAIVASAAITCYTVGTVKDIAGLRTYVSVDGGMSDNPRPVLYGSGYEAFLVRDVLASRTRRVTVVGKHCESGDVIVRDAQVPHDLKVGDVLATPVTGAYGHSMASTYNKVPRPPVVFVRDGAARVVIRRETLDDLMALDS